MTDSESSLMWDLTKAKEAAEREESVRLLTSVLGNIFQHLRINGFTREEAMSLTQIWFRAMLDNAMRGNGAAPARGEQEARR